MLLSHFVRVVTLIRTHQPFYCVKLSEITRTGGRTVISAKPSFFLFFLYRFCTRPKRHEHTCTHTTQSDDSHRVDLLTYLMSKLWSHHPPQAHTKLNSAQQRSHSDDKLPPKPHYTQSPTADIVWTPCGYSPKDQLQPVQGVYHLTHWCG